MTMASIHILHLASSHLHHQQQEKHSAYDLFSKQCGRRVKIEDTQRHLCNRLYVFVHSVSSSGIPASHRHSKWRILTDLDGGAVVGMEVKRCWRSSVCSRTAEWSSGRAVPGHYLSLASFRKQGAGRRPVVAMFCSAPGKQLGSNSNSDFSPSSRDSPLALWGGRLVGPDACRGGETAIKGIISGGKTVSEDDMETRGLGRRAAVLLGGSILLSGLGCCRICQEALAEQDWDYGGPCGPAKWDGMCTSGSKQSPVDITSSNTKDGGSLGLLNFVYVASTVSVKNTGHGTIQVNFGKPNNFLKVRGHALQLLQFHFHAPSEHAFDGRRYPMEAHLVHRDPVTKKLVVVGVMLDASKTAPRNKCLAASLKYVPREHGLSMDAPIEVSPSFLLPPVPKNGSRGYVHYGGSLTTPPCSEGVEWFVLDTPLKISSSQVFDFIDFSGDGQTLAFNSRPLQPLGKRKIFKGP